MPNRVLPPVAVALLLSACVDSELVGQMKPSPDGDALSFTGFEVFVPDVPGDADVPPRPCTSDEQCQLDSQQCAFCVEGFCVRLGDEHVGVLGCCETDLDCSAATGQCTIGLCPIPGPGGGGCVSVETCGCTSDAWCQERAPICQTGTCGAGAVCSFKDSGLCCDADADCQDGDLCTTDLCTDRLCRFEAVAAEPDPGPACCTATPRLDTSFAPAPEGLTTASDGQGVTWQVADNPGTPSPPASLGLTLAGGEVPASALATASFALGTVDAGAAYEVKLQQSVSLPEALPAGSYRAELAAGSWKTTLFTQATVQQGGWVSGTWTGLVGQSGALSLRFVFETVQFPLGGYGVWVDDLKVRIGCQDVPPICTSDAQCKTGNACLDERCVQGACVTATLPGCCNTAAECPGTPGVCAQTECQNHGCVSLTKPGCCETDAQCPGWGGCSQGYCNAATHTCVYVDDPNCCITAADCPPAPLPCATVSCMAGQCVTAIDPACCGADADCYDGNPCTTDDCQGEACVFTPIVGCQSDCKPSIFFDDLEGGQGIWTISNSDPTIGWHVVDHPQNCSGSAGLYYGDPKNLDNYGEGITSSGTARSPFIALPTSALSIGLGFLYVGDIEEGDFYDFLEVALVTSTGLRTTLFDKGGYVNGACVTPQVDLTAWKGQTVQIELLFDTGDSILNGTFGLVFDNFQVSAVCEACQSAAQCPKPGPCEEAICTGGVCTTAPVLGCCTSNGQCADDKTCTADACNLASGTCSHTGTTCASAAECPSAPPCALAQCIGGCCSLTNVPDCCTQDSQCASADPCKIAACDETSGKCFTTPNPECGCQKASDCQDGDACTVDSCVGGKCSYAEKAGCCNKVADCEPGPLCTTPSCEQNECKHTYVLNCCESDSDCNDKNSCTADFCIEVAGVASYCLNQPLGGPGCCISDAQCPDQNCLDGTCNKLFQCEWAEKPGACCVTDAQCDDGKACTGDWCQDGECVHEGMWWCCESDAECDTGDPCTAAWCTPEGFCEYVWNGSCCTWDGDCFDGDPCTAEYCDFQTGTCQYPTWPPGCCESAEDCEDGLWCTTHTCQGQACVTSTQPGCCETDAQCATGDPCLAGTCVDHACQTTLVLGCCKVNAECLDANPCTTDTCLQVPIPGGGFAGICQHTPVPGDSCCASDAQCPSGGPCTVAKCSQFQCTLEPIAGCCSTAKDCGDPGPCKSVSCIAQTCVTSPVPGCCTSDLDCEDGDPCTQDVCLDGGQCYFLPTPAGGECKTDFDCEDGDPCTLATCASCGVCDVILAGCDDGNPCTTDLCEPGGGCLWLAKSCDDGDACTDDFCDPATGQCVYAGSPECCTTSAQCQDGDKCTTDSCVGGQCQHPKIDGCCTKAADCDDGYLCSEDSCVGGQCEHVYDIFCCTTDAECNDQNTCTQDVCITFMQYGFCDNPPQPGPGCCFSSQDCADTPCQQEECVKYQCVAGPAEEGCCTESAECDDGDPCTIDFCQGFTCFNTPSPFCECTADWECEDFISCTQNTCVANQCVSTPIAGMDCCTPGADQTTLQKQCGQAGACCSWQCDPFWFLCMEVCNDDVGCCGSAAECDDSNGCTTDSCNGGLCQNATIPGCQCDDASDCVDGDPCTTDLGCVGGKCQTAPVANCCTSDGACADTDPCTLDVCSGNQCQHLPDGTLPGCSECEENADCPSDGNACTAERCLVKACSSLPIAGCCASAAECDDGNAATSDACVGGFCAWSPAPTQCGSDAACDDGNTCTQDTCAASCPSFSSPVHSGGRCYQVFAKTTTWFQAHSECELRGGHLVSLETPDVFAVFSASLGATCGGQSFWNGFNDLAQEGQWRWSDGTPTTGFELWAGGEPNDCGDCCDAGSEDVGQAYGDGQLNDLCAQLTQSCFVCEKLATQSCQHLGTAGCCTTDAECEDGSACTQNTCDGQGKCKPPVPIAGCCTTNAECADKDTCTSDLCQGGKCSNLPVADCCKGDKECNDQNPCTLDLCQGSKCTHTPAGDGCCVSSADCEDGDPCTIDYCDVANTCQSIASPPIAAEEICGDGVDNDCDPSTFCYELTTPTQTLAITPIDGWEDVVAFYGYSWQNQASAKTGYEISNQATLLLYRDPSGNVSLVYILDAVQDGSGGQFEMYLTGMDGMAILVYDDPPTAGSNDYYEPDGAGGLYTSWQWGQCCTDGMALGYFDEASCLNFEIWWAKGINGVTAWTDMETTVGLDLSSMSFQLCGVQ